MKLFLLFSFLSISPIFYGQNTSNTFQTNKFSNNKLQLKNVLKHYEKTGEVEKYKAALFLITNMSIHQSNNYKWVDTNKKIIPFNETEFANIVEASKVFKQLKDSLNLKPKFYRESDIKHITTDYLINNIDLAFFEWKNNPWSVSYSFSTFCEYILPYRSLTEPISNWRTIYKEKIVDNLTNIKDSKDPTEIATLAIIGLSNYKFTSRNKDPIPLISAKQLLFRDSGTCPNLANLALFGSRSVGVAVTFDFTPHYAASSNRHFWNTVIDKNGKSIPFNGNAFGNVQGGLPYAYNPNNKRLGKVFRKTFSIQTNALASLVPIEKIPRSFLTEKNIIDVTEEYVNISNIDYKFINKKSTPKVAYLNVYNTGSWKIVDWCELTKENKCIYKNLGVNLIYLPSIYENRQNKLEQYPILIDVEKSNTILKPNYSKTFSTTISREKEVKNVYKENNTLEIEEGQNYTLLCWDSKWKKIGVAKATKKGVFFKNIPENALFLLKPQKYDGFERVFILDHKTKKIIWY